MASTPIAEDAILRTFLCFWVAVIISGCSSTPGPPAPTPSSTVSVRATAATPTETQHARATQTSLTPLPLTSFPGLPAGDLEAATALALQRVLDALVADGEPDAIAAVITPDGQWAGAAGIDGPGGRLATPADMFNIPGASKPILAATVIRLAERGQLELDKPLSAYLGAMDVDANGATVRQALAMRSGIPDTPDAVKSEARSDCTRIWSRAEVLAVTPAADGEPGEAFVYSNPTYRLLGFAIEEVTGHPIAKVLHDEAFAPLGLERIVAQGPETVTPQPWSLPIEGHGGELPLADFGVGGTLPCLSVSTLATPALALATDAPSLARWGWGLFAGDLISHEGLVAMTTTNDNQGLGLERAPELRTLGGIGASTHQVGYTSWLVVVPERSIVVVVSINDAEGDATKGVRELIEALGD
jgi:D-alanyl-D-alanine carboxypeptidase